ncbi:MAG: YeeE/YedE family protein [Saprospiraceae bacterium]|nr:YeeE/YedE family protein [Saprospiraceae bacterium]
MAEVQVTEPEIPVLSPETDFEVRSLDTMCINESQLQHPWWHNLKYLVWGIIFGIAFVKAEIISWFRMQEMFRLQSFHMYGVIGTGVAIGALSVWLIKKFKIKTIYGESIEFHRKKFNKGQVIGGLIFGLGWAMTGACPGPLFAQIGTGALVVAVPLLSAIAGTWAYGYFRDRLIH